MNLKLELQSHQKVFVGITEGDLKLLSQNMNALSTKKRNLSCRWPGSYGWEIGHDGVTVWHDGVTACQDGSRTTDRNLQNMLLRLQAPYTVKLVVLSVGSDLEIHVLCGRFLLV